MGFFSVKILTRNGMAPKIASSPARPAGRARVLDSRLKTCDFATLFVVVFDRFRQCGVRFRYSSKTEFSIFLIVPFLIILLCAVFGFDILSENIHFCLAGLFYVFWNRNIGSKQAISAVKNDQN